MQSVVLSFLLFVFVLFGYDPTDCCRLFNKHVNAIDLLQLYAKLKRLASHCMLWTPFEPIIKILPRLRRRIAKAMETSFHTGLVSG